MLGVTNNKEIQKELYMIFINEIIIGSIVCSVGALSYLKGFLKRKLKNKK